MKNNHKWHLMFSGVASTPDYTIRAGETFKDALTGELICTFPETNTRNAERVTSNAKKIVATQEMLDLISQLTQISPLGGQTRFNMDVFALQEQARAIPLKTGGAE